ncbi:hypothetical protein ACIP88_14555 [Streptomyces uncialis]|uniref:hypothetical protein n=1 Tax=Streptomyces uncialis TaxID=1048205 RepID=UPI0038041255
MDESGTHEPDVWALILKEHGFVDVSASVIAAPPGSRRTTGTLLVRGVRGVRGGHEQPVASD